MTYGGQGESRTHSDGFADQLAAATSLTMKHIGLWW